MYDKIKLTGIMSVILAIVISCLILIPESPTAFFKKIQFILTTIAVTVSVVSIAYVLIFSLGNVE